MSEINEILKKTKLIIFDLGGVLVNLDVSLTVEAFNNLGLGSITAQMSAGHHGGEMAKLERGEITENQFYDHIINLSGNGVSRNQIKDAWNAMLTDLPANRIRIVEHLKKEHKVVLLSNTNSIHHTFFDGMADGYRSMDDLFDKVWYSHRMGMSKPDTRIFKHVMEHHGFLPGETMLIDDSSANISAAEELGMLTWHITPGRPLESYNIE